MYKFSFYIQSKSGFTILVDSHVTIDLFLDSDSFITAYRFSLVNVQTNFCKNNLWILDVEKLNKIMKLYYFYTLKALWDDQGKIKMYYGMYRAKKQLLGKRSIAMICSTLACFQKFNISGGLYTVEYL